MRNRRHQYEADGGGKQADQHRGAGAEARGQGLEQHRAHQHADPAQHLRRAHQAGRHAEHARGEQHVQRGVGVEQQVPAAGGPGQHAQQRVGPDERQAVEHVA